MLLPPPSFRRRQPPRPSSPSDAPRLARGHRRRPTPRRPRFYGLRSVAARHHRDRHRRVDARTQTAGRARGARCTRASRGRSSTRWRSTASRRRRGSTRSRSARRCSRWPAPRRRSSPGHNVGSWKTFLSRPAFTCRARAPNVGYHRLDTASALVAAGRHRRLPVDVARSAGRKLLGLIKARTPPCARGCRCSLESRATPGGAHARGGLVTAPGR